MKTFLKAPAFISYNHLIQVGKIHASIQPIDLFNKIEIELINERKIHIKKTAGFKIATNHTHLAYQAAKELQALRPNKFGAAISIQQNIPTNSGLWSEPSTAAVVLMALNKLWKFNLSHSELLALAESIDERLLKVLHIFLDQPNFDHQCVALIRYRHLKMNVEWLKSKLDLSVDSKNPIEKICFSYFPDLLRLKNKLNLIKNNGVGMSDYGPTFFIFSDQPFDEFYLNQHFAEKSDFIYIGNTCNPYGELLN